MEDKLSKVKTSLHRLKATEEWQLYVDELIKACAWEVVFRLENTVQQCQTNLQQYPQLVQKVCIPLIPHCFGDAVYHINA